MKRLLQIIGLLMIAGMFMPAHAAIVNTGKTCHNTANATSSVTCTPSANFSSGEFLACFVQSFTTGVTYTVTDSAGNSYTQNGSVFSDGVSAFLVVFYFPSLTGTVTSVTANFSPVAAFNSIDCDSYTGVATASVTDGQATGTGTGTTPGNTLSTAAITTTANGDLLHCGLLAYIAGTMTIGTGFTQGSTVDNTLFNQYLVQTSSGSITPTWNAFVSGSRSSAICSAYKAAAGAAAGAPTMGLLGVGK